MSEIKKAKKPEDNTSAKKPEKEEQTVDLDEIQDPKEGYPSHSAGYIKDKKTGKWKIVNPAGSVVYNYLNRDEFPDE